MKLPIYLPPKLKAHLLIVTGDLLKRFTELRYTIECAVVGRLAG